MSNAGNLANFATNVNPSGDINAGVITATEINSSGIITASAFFGDGAGLTGVGAGLPQVLTFSPLDGETNVSPATNIILTFNQGVAIGTGNITLRNSSGIGTVLQTIGINSTSVRISGAQVIIDPPSILPVSTDVYVGVDTGALTNVNGQEYVGLSTYNFTTRDDVVASYSPDNGATGVSYESSIVLTFPFNPLRGTGTVELRRGAVDGTVIETYDALTSNRISVSGNQWILDPTNIFLPDDVIYVIIPDTGITNYAGLNIGGGTKSYSFTVQSVTYLSISPAIGSTNVGISSNIVLSFDNVPARGIGTVSLRLNDATGQVIEDFDAASSDRITVDGFTWVLNPTYNLPAGSLIYLIIPSTAIVGFAGLTIGGETFPYSITTQDQNLFVWGFNNIGQLGQNNNTAYSSPVQIPGTNWTSTSARGGRTFAIKGTELFVWGDNSYGSLGQNDATPRSSPVQIPGTQWSSVAGDYYGGLATKFDGTLWGWGLNRGRLGLSDGTDYSSPRQIPGTQWKLISSGDDFSLAIKTDGTLWSWGYNTVGQLGQNNRIRYSSPTQIPGTQWSSIGSGDKFGFGIKSDGTLWSWGYNAYGNLGQNNRTYYSSPVQISGTQWRSIDGDRYMTMATKSDGTLWSWGYNARGNLGQNNNLYHSSPVQIPGTQWSSTITMSRGSFAIKTDNTLWSWGANPYGNLGQSNRTYCSSPIQIPGTSWSFVDIDADDNTVALKTN